MNMTRVVIASTFVTGIAVGVFFVTHGPSLIPSSVAQESSKGEPLI